jgi:hypothetical protein
MKTNTTKQEADPKSLTQSLGEEFDSDAFLNSLSGLKPAQAPEEEVASEEQEEEVVSDENVSEEEQEQEEEPAQEEEEPAEEEESEEEDVLSQIDLDALDDKQKADLAIRLGSGAGKELSKLRRENREYEEKLTALQAKIEKQLGGMIPANNPYGNIKDAESLEKAVAQDQWTKKQIINLIKTQEETYKDPDTMEGEKGYFIGDQFYSKKQVTDELDQLDSKLSKAYEQSRRLEKLSSLSSVKEEVAESLNKYSWFSDEDSKQAKKYKEIMSEPDVAILEDLVPSFAARLPEMVAAYIDKGNKTPRKMVLPLKKPTPTGGTRSSGATGSDTRRNPAKSDAFKRINQGNYEPSDVVKAFFQ